eukprot:6033582-Prymnesium_polylepis.1
MAQCRWPTTGTSSYAMPGMPPPSMRRPGSAAEQGAERRRVSRCGGEGSHRGAREGARGGRGGRERERERESGARHTHARARGSTGHLSHRL